MLLLTTTIYDVSVGIKVVCGRYQDVWIVWRGVILWKIATKKKALEKQYKEENSTVSNVNSSTAKTKGYLGKKGKSDQAANTQDCRKKCDIKGYTPGSRCEESGPRLLVQARRADSEISSWPGRVSHNFASRAWAVWKGRRREMTATTKSSPVPGTPSTHMSVHSRVAIFTR